jgi:predicted metal-binding transcription factor (methanogenesis marker protein 9)
MIHKITVSIELDLINLSQEKYLEIQAKLMKNIIDTDAKKLSFNELDKILHIKERKYVSKSIQYPEMNRLDDNDFTIKETFFEIVG